MRQAMAKNKKLAKFLAYVLGRQPDEFGLVPDAQGFVPAKTLIKALNEEEGWRHVRLAHLNEIVATFYPAPIEIQAGQVRAADRSRLPRTEASDQLPKLLYMPIRRRAYETIMANGAWPADGDHLVMSDDRDMALRLGRRIDNPPVVLTIQVAASRSKGIRYLRYGQHLCLASGVAAGTFSGPPRPKERPQAARQKAPPPPTAPKTPGSYLPEPSDFMQAPEKTAGAKQRDRADWKKARRQARRFKSRQQE